MAAVYPQNNHSELVNNLRDYGYIRHQIIYDIMESVDRADFLTSPDRDFIDWMVRFELNHETKESPIKDAIVLGLMTSKLKEGNRALDIGMGTGYLTVCMARALGETGLVVGMDCQPKFVDKAKQIIQVYHADLLGTHQIVLTVGDGRYGCETDMLYDIINVNVAYTRVPLELLKQLNHGGRLIMPIIEEGGKQILTMFIKSASGNHITISKKMPVNYGIISSFYWKEKAPRPFSNFNVRAKTVDAKIIQEHIQEYKKTASATSDETIQTFTENMQIMQEELVKEPYRYHQFEESNKYWISSNQERITFTEETEIMIAKLKQEMTELHRQSDLVNEFINGNRIYEKPNITKEKTITEMKAIAEQNWIELGLKVLEMKIASLFCPPDTTTVIENCNQQLDREYSMYINKLNNLDTRIKAFKKDLQSVSSVLKEIKEESSTESM